MVFRCARDVSRIFVSPVLLALFYVLYLVVLLSLEYIVVRTL